VRYTEAERRTLSTLDTMRIRTPGGFEVPFSTVANAELGRGFSSIKRADRRRVVNVTADVDRTQITANEVLAGSDVLCTQTTVAPHQGPVFPDGPHQQHLHINAVGADLAGKTELPLTLLRRAHVVPDFPEQAIAEGECQQLSSDEIGLELAELLAKDAGKQLRKDLTIFDSTGWAIEDLVAAELIIELAVERGLGKNIELEGHPADPRDVYDFTAVSPALSMSA
ncbi:MAG: hypothetical protein AAF585_12170, partial [Verrucomicrobiota bacterium]